VQATSVALERLYELFDVPPVRRRVQHDGKSAIVVRSALWEEQHQVLWELLVPSSGSASTVQGEVVRISGRIQNDLEGNEGVNWDGGHKRMADAFLVHMASGVPLAENLMSVAHEIVSAVKGKNGDARRLCELTVKWAAQNPTPMKLATPDYDR